ncbi:MAG: DUF4381 domain-containing protein [Aquimonas sp.]|nr:DUF4381 domain-containing protein [Aquimonas sp.]
MSAGPQLRDIQLPPEPGLWLPAPLPGLLAVLALLALGWLCWRWRERILRQRHRRRWLDAHARIECELAPGVPQVAAASELLHRALRQYAPEAAALHGQAWLDWLDALLPEAPPSAGPAACLRDAAWRAQLAPDEARAATEALGRALARVLERSP